MSQKNTFGSEIRWGLQLSRLHFISTWIQALPGNSWLLFPILASQMSFSFLFPFPSPFHATLHFFSFGYRLIATQRIRQPDLEGVIWLKGDASRTLWIAIFQPRHNIRLTELKNSPPQLKDKQTEQLPLPMQEGTALGGFADAQTSQPCCPSPHAHAGDPLLLEPLSQGGQQRMRALQGGGKQHQGPLHPIRPLARTLSNTQMK